MNLQNLPIKLKKLIPYSIKLFNASIVVTRDQRTFQVSIIHRRSSNPSDHRCKADLFRYMRDNMQLFLPQQSRCPLRFLQQILRDEKLVINRQAVPQLFVPNWPELGVRTIWPQAARVRDFLKHLPDDWRSDHNTERKFFYGVLTSLAP